MPRSDIEKRLQERIDKGKKLLSISICSESDLSDVNKKKEKWSKYNGELLRRIVDSEDLVNEYDQPPDWWAWGETSFTEQINDFRNEMNRFILRLESILERLELIPESSTFHAGAEVNTAVLQESRADILLQNRTRLRELMVRYFSKVELETLCFDLGIDKDNLPNATKPELAQEIILYCERYGKLDKLLEICRKQRPHANWPDEL